MHSLLSVAINKPRGKKGHLLSFSCVTFLHHSWWTKWKRDYLYCNIWETKTTELKHLHIKTKKHASFLKEIKLKRGNFCFPTMDFIVIFVTTVCMLFFCQLQHLSITCGLWLEFKAQLTNMFPLPSIKCLVAPMSFWKLPSAP